jgi:predicted HTH domain antitoxin
MFIGNAQMKSKPPSPPALIPSPVFELRVDCHFSSTMLFTNVIMKLYEGNEKMQTVVLDVPESTEMSEQQIRMFVAAKLYEAGRLNSGLAAEMAGVTRRDFLEQVGEYGVSIFDQTIDEVLSDMNHA